MLQTTGNKEKKVSNRLKDRLKEGVVRLLKDVKTLAIVCYQWGDSGKGKIVDLFAHLWADIIIRGGGGANAGHTIVIKGKKYVFHLIPSGILHDADGKVNVIGRGVALDPNIICKELRTLDEEGKSYNNFIIDMNAILVLPQHILLDKIKEHVAGSKKIGTTGRGIGPAYVDHYNRVGLSVNDLLNKDILHKKLKNNFDDKIRILRTYDREVIQKILYHEHLESGIFYSRKDILDLDVVVDTYFEYGKKLDSTIRDTSELIRNSVGNKNILLEGAQGVGLSVDFGTYPFVTSSDSSPWGLAHGAGLPDKAIDMTLGVVKAFYQTRVGEGPFPTEIKGTEASILRDKGDEYGATTGRLRRVGWLDLPFLRYVSQRFGPNVILTKLDVLNYYETINICNEYIYHGEQIRVGAKTLISGDKLNVAIPDAGILENCYPTYQEFKGWKSDVSSLACLKDMPNNFREIYNYIVEKGNINPRILSIGADRYKTIFV